jgi:aspartate/tyrosine/aromatic aminotransferase
MLMKFAKVFTIVGLMVAALAMTSWASGNEVKGTLNAVDVAGMTVTVNNQVYSVSANVTVKVKNQGYIPFSQLPNYVGQWVELKLTAQGLVYKIEVKTSSSPGGGGSTKVQGLLNAVDVAGLTVTVNNQVYPVSANVVVKVEKQGYIPRSTSCPTMLGVKLS